MRQYFSQHEFTADITFKDIRSAFASFLNDDIELFKRNKSYRDKRDEIVRDINNKNNLNRDKQ